MPFGTGTFVGLLSDLRGAAARPEGCFQSQRADRVVGPGVVAIGTTALNRVGLNRDIYFYSVLLRHRGAEQEAATVPFAVLRR
jgi:hypothetical protein